MSDDGQQKNNQQDQVKNADNKDLEESIDNTVLQDKQTLNEQDITKVVDENSKQDLLNKENEYLQGWQRAKADYENLKREVERERKEMGIFARTMVAMDFIPIYDNFKKASAHEPKLTESEESKLFKQWMNGILHIKSQFKEVLKQIGIEEIPSVGEQFDPHLHESVEERESSGILAGQIIAEVSGGYKMGERILQAAKVIIAK